MHGMSSSSPEEQNGLKSNKSYKRKKHSEQHHPTPQQLEPNVCIKVEAPDEDLSSSPISFNDRNNSRISSSRKKVCLSIHHYTAYVVTKFFWVSSDEKGWSKTYLDPLDGVCITLITGWINSNSETKVMSIFIISLQKSRKIFDPADHDQPVRKKKAQSPVSCSGSDSLSSHDTNTVRHGVPKPREGGCIYCGLAQAKQRKGGRLESLIRCNDCPTTGTTYLWIYRLGKEYLDFDQKYAFITKYSIFTQ